LSASVLVLNSSYEPLNVVGLKRAVRLILSGKAEVVHSTGKTIHSEVMAIPMPSVLRMLYYITHRRKSVPLTKKNVLLRDDYTCGYCSVKGGREMTVDHINPRAKGGKSTWNNLVACCSRCNARKRDRTPEEAGMALRIKPHVPKYIPFVVVKRNTLPDEWGLYITTYNVGIEERVH
jgi:5-methylcytosine-specific restriction endonuclease McrA